jgi:hypothetical protein
MTYLCQLRPSNRGDRRRLARRSATGIDGACGADVEMLEIGSVSYGGSSGIAAGFPRFLAAASPDEPAKPAVIELPRQTEEPLH